MTQTTAKPISRKVWKFSKTVNLKFYWLVFWHHRPKYKENYLWLHFPRLFYLENKNKCNACDQNNEYRVLFVPLSVSQFIGASIIVAVLQEESVCTLKQCNILAAQLSHVWHIGPNIIFSQKQAEPASLLGKRTFGGCFFCIESWYPHMSLMRMNTLCGILLQILHFFMHTRVSRTLKAYTEYTSLAPSAQHCSALSYPKLCLLSPWRPCSCKLFVSLQLMHFHPHQTWFPHTQYLEQRLETRQKIKQGRN